MSASWPQLAQRRPPVARKRTVEVTLRCARGTRAWRRWTILLRSASKRFFLHLNDEIASGRAHGIKRACSAQMSIQLLSHRQHDCTGQ